MKTDQTTDSIVKSQWFKQPIDKVWKAITENNQVSQWLVPTNFKAEVGFNYYLQDPKGECNVVTGTVKKATPYSLEYTWINEEVKEVETLVSWELIEEKGGTLLKMAHSGIAKYQEAVKAKMAESYTAGWNRCFDNITSLLK
ncbi:MAG: SRPBCC domain-containing protein [Vicingaceae bacterium]